jgi:hypothetical protein
MHQRGKPASWITRRRMFDPRNPNMGVLLDFSNSRPSRQASLVRKQREMFTDPDRQPWNYYGAVLRFVKQAAAASDPRPALDAMVASVAGTPKERHFRALRDGLLTAWNPADGLVAVKSATCTTRVFGVKVNPQLGYRTVSGDLAAVFLYLKEEPLDTQSAQPLLTAMAEVMDEVLPSGSPRILDVRRGAYHDLAGRTAHKTRLMDLAGLLGMWYAMWEQAA